MNSLSVDNMLEVLKSTNIKIPISEVVGIVYTPTGTELNALVASPEFMEEKELVYVEGGSQHGMLVLCDIPKKRVGKLYEQKDVKGYYDKDASTRKISAIYLQKKDVFKAAYFGNLEELIRNPNIRKREDA